VVGRAKGEEEVVDMAEGVVWLLRRWEAESDVGRWDGICKEEDVWRQIATSERKRTRIHQERAQVVHIEAKKENSWVTAPQSSGWLLSHAVRKVKIDSLAYQPLCSSRESLALGRGLVGKCGRAGSKHGTGALSYME